MNDAMTLADIAKLTGGEIRGDADTRITGVASVTAAGSGDVTWISRQRFADKLENCQAAAVLIPKDFGSIGLPAILCENIDWAVADVLGAFAKPPAGPPIGVDATACVAPSATLGADVAIGPHVVIQDGASIGDRTVLCAGVYVGDGCAVGSDCRFWNNVVVREGSQVGDRVVIHPNTVIGADGFGFVFRDGRHRKVPHLGCVTIEDDVEIGACSTVDRSKVGTTLVGRGTKIDNLVQVAHNVQIGEHCLLCAQAGVAGSTTLGDAVVLGGQAGIRDNIVLQDGTMVAGCSCVAQDTSPGSKVAGIPAIDSREFLRTQTGLRKQPVLISQLRDLARRVQELERAANHNPKR